MHTTVASEVRRRAPKLLLTVGASPPGMQFNQGNLQDAHFSNTQFVTTPKLHAGLVCHTP
eukprot:993367-Amphidinium_carterae.1